MPFNCLIVMLDISRLFLNGSYIKHFFLGFLKFIVEQAFPGTTLKFLKPCAHVDIVKYLILKLHFWNFVCCFDHWKLAVLISGSLETKWNKMVMKRVKQSKYYFHGDNEKKLQNMFSATSTVIDRNRATSCKNSFRTIATNVPLI